MDLTDVQILGYSARGLLAQGVPAATGAGPTRPVLRLQQVRLDPLGSAGATVGIDVAGTDLGLRDSIVHGNSGDGIRGKEGGLLTLANATITGNGGHGVAVTAVLLGGDLLQGNHFGGNLQGDVQARVPVVARLLDGQDAVVEGANLAVFGPRGVPVLNATGLFAGTILAALDVYRQAPDGTSHFLGPFTYELRHARLARPVMGTLDLAAPVITAHLPAGEPSGVSLLLAGGGLVAGAAVAWSLWVAGRRQRPEA
jgi:hypothetical protein